MGGRRSLQPVRRAGAAPTSGPPLPAATNHAVSDAASSAAGPAPGVDWLAELALPPQAKPQGVPVSTRAPGDMRRGRAIESKRGQR